ncbi:MAG: ATP-binding protein [Bacteroidota bacterium]
MSKYFEAQIRYQGISRIEEYAYPETALREAIINAIVHKDYSSGNPIQIKVYDDRINIWNSGELQAPLTVKKLLVTHPSMPFNPDIATTFFRTGLIEAWGRGTIKIIEDCKAYGLPSPTFSSEFSGLMVTFYNATSKSSVKSSVKIMELMAQNNTISLKEIANHLGLTARAVEKQVAALKKENKLKRGGAARGGYWRVL